MSEQDKRSVLQIEIPESLREFYNSVETQRIIKEVCQDPAYFLRLCRMSQLELLAEIDRLEEETKHYRNASGDELDYHWPPSAKARASALCEKMHLALKVLAKYEEISSLMTEAVKAK